MSYISHMSRDEVLKALKKNNLPHDIRVVTIHKNCAWMQLNTITFIEVAFETNYKIKGFKNFESTAKDYTSTLPNEQGYREWYDTFDKLVTKIDNIKKLINKL